MKLTKNSYLILILALVLGAIGIERLSAQAGRAASPAKLGTSATQTPNAKSTTPKQPPCWQEAGISKATMEERRSIQERRRAEIEEVCSQTSLTDQEKMQRIREINQAAKQQLAGLITPEQEEKLKACNKGRTSSHPASGTSHTGGPCAQFGH